MAASLAERDRALLRLLQDDFPLVARPYSALAAALGRPEQEVIASIEALKDGPLRQIGAIFDTRRLGYASTLVALAVQPEHLDEVAEAASRHPGVSHNYSRNHAYNLWFTLAVPPGQDLATALRSLAGLPGVLQALDLPAVRTFKVDVRFDLGMGEPGEPARPAGVCPGEGLAPAEVPFVRALQDDLPLIPRPFALLAERYALDETALLEAAWRLRRAGIMRRYGATLRHREAGFTENAMVCWELPEERIAPAGEAAALHPAVSHCYQRRASPPNWPYQLFTMVHGRSPGELGWAIAGLQSRIQPERLAVLRTLREYKKTRLRYFEDGWPTEEATSQTRSDHEALRPFAAALAGGPGDPPRRG